MDVLTKKQRSYCMSRIRSIGTKAEIMLKKELKKHGFIYQPKLFGKPDFANIKRRVVVFVDGCFWHKCPKCYQEPKTRKNFWLLKIKRNVRRDKEVNKELRKRGWKVIRIWEHDIKKNFEKVVRRIANANGRSG